MTRPRARVSGPTNKQQTNTSPPLRASIYCGDNKFRHNYTRMRVSIRVERVWKGGMGDLYVNGRRSWGWAKRTHGDFAALIISDRLYFVFEFLRVKDIRKNHHREYNNKINCRRNDDDIAVMWCVGACVDGDVHSILFHNLCWTEDKTMMLWWFSYSAFLRCWCRFCAVSVYVALCKHVSPNAQHTHTHIQTMSALHMCAYVWWLASGPSGWWHGKAKRT